MGPAHPEAECQKGKEGTEKGRAFLIVTAALLRRMTRLPDKSLSPCQARGVPSLHADVRPQRKAPKDAAASDYVVTDEKAELVEADEDDEDLLEDGDTFRLGQQDEEFHDFSSLKLKDDAHNRQAELSSSQAARSRQSASRTCEKYDE